MDRSTRKWIRNASDERAAANGCRFDERRAAHICEFFPRYLRLYEGEFAGQPFDLQCWQAEALSRAFGWLKWSEHFGRWVRRFRRVGLWVPKKNGKSPLAAGVGLYLLIADGEQGQKVFSAAKDGKQAQIVHMHARKMVEMSPELSDLCSINKSTGRISFASTNSFYDLLCGDNIDGQEGLNGSAVIDEIHVVDARLARVLRYMGASRAEAMQFQVSTAGNDPTGYGKQEYDYGRAVEAGTFADDAYLHIAYEAPTDATDEALYDDEAAWKLANPSWGRTVNPDEFRAEAKAAQRSLAAWTDFKMYRLNRWSASSNPWLREDDWARARPGVSHDVYCESLAGQSCWVGLDLAKTCDLTAAVFVFRDGEDEATCRYKLLAKYWLPRSEAESMNHQVPYLQWARDGWLTLIDAKAVDYAIVEADLVELDKTYRIEQVIFDPKYAENLTQRLELEHGIPRLAFGQTMLNFAGPTAAFERLLIDGRLEHDGNPITSWMAGHVNYKTDNNENKRPVKPENAEHLKIDGIIAAVMGLAGAMEGAAAPSFYESNAVEMG